jgi:hypothetical protein
LPVACRELEWARAKMRREWEWEGSPRSSFFLFDNAQGAAAVARTVICYTANSFVLACPERAMALQGGACLDWGNGAE